MSVEGTQMTAQQRAEYANSRPVLPQPQPQPAYSASSSTGAPQNQQPRGRNPWTAQEPDPFETYDPWLHGEQNNSSTSGRSVRQVD